MPVPILDLGGRSVSANDLVIVRARALAHLLASGVLEYASLIECRQGPTSAPSGEAVIVKLDVERPQLTAHPICQSEIVAAVFDPDLDMAPEVLALRADFPLVPHVNLRRAEFPRSLCLDERSWHEASRRWTPADFVKRIRWWLAQTARGTLHHRDQPLEPLLLDTAVPLILPADLLSSPLQKQEMLIVKSLSGPDKSITLRAERTTAIRGDGADPTYVAIALSCRPQPHGIIRHRPDTLDELSAFTAAAGLDLQKELKARLREWRFQKQIRLARLVILLSLPKQRLPNGPVESSDHFAVACFDTITEVAIKLGAWHLKRPVKKAPRRRGKKALKFPKAGDPINVYLLRPTFGLTPSRAAQLCGDPVRTNASRIAIGVGALGSQLLSNMARAGYSGWTIVDDDRVLPHNLQRHALDGFSIGDAKANSLAIRMNSFFDGKPVASSIPVNYLHPGKDEVRLTHSVINSDEILDISTSITVARDLAWRNDLTGRCASVFLNPTGTDLVLLAEDSNRTIRLDALETQYYRAVLRESALAHHLRPPHGRVRYSGSCRDVSTHVHTHLVAVLAAIGAGAVPVSFTRQQASIMIWHADVATLAVTPIVAKPAAVRRGQIADWTLVIDDDLLALLDALRAEKLPNETGGVLLGVYDMDRRAVYVVDATPSPPDSAEWPVCYVRGCEGLPEQIAKVRSRTAGQVEYIGEWHSHPNGCSTRPSSDDQNVFAWQAQHMVAEGLPPLMAIVGEGASSSWYLDEMLPSGGFNVTRIQGSMRG